MKGRFSIKHSPTFNTIIVGFCDICKCIAETSHVKRYDVMLCDECLAQEKQYNYEESRKIWAKKLME